MSGRKLIMPCRKFVLLFLAAALLIVAGFATSSSAEVNVRIGPPTFVFQAPPSVVVIPGTYVYIVPEIDTNILFYQGYWWRPYEGRWYRGRNYSGPWGYVGSRGIPRALVNLPPNYHEYRTVRPGFDRIGHNDIRRNWRGWERNKHWDNHEGWSQGRGERSGHGERGGGPAGRR
jgi:hypothetical protein